MKKLLALFILIFTSLIFIKNADAKLLPQSVKSKVKQSAIKSNSTTIGVYPKLRPDRRALNINFTNLQNAKSVSYMLVYEHSSQQADKTSSQEEAAMGALNLTGGSTSKNELLFGTCSKNVCRYHSGVHNARLEVSYTLNTGKKYLKKFKIKV